MLKKYRFYNTSGDGEETPAPSDDGGLGEDIVGYNLTNIYQISVVPHDFKKRMHPLVLDQISRIKVMRIHILLIIQF